MSKSNQKPRHEQEFDAIVAKAQDLLERLEQERDTVNQERLEGIPAVYAAKYRILKVGLKRFLHRATFESQVPVATVKTAAKRAEAAKAAPAKQDGPTKDDFDQMSPEQVRAYAKILGVSAATKPGATDDELRQAVAAARGWEVESPLKPVTQALSKLTKEQLEQVAETVQVPIEEGAKKADILTALAETAAATPEDLAAVKDAIDLLDA